MSNPTTAVIILNWNGEKLLKEFLPSVIAHTPQEKGRVIVADNGSTDNSVAWLRESCPEVELMLFPRNYGFAEGYNRAISAVKDKYKYAVLLNSDVAVSNDWLTPLIDCLDGNPDIAACQPKLLSYREPQLFEYAGASGGFIDRHGYPFCRGRIFATCESDNGQYDTPLTVDWASGAALAVRTDIYLKAGGLDSSFFAHMEEIDLCWRIRRMGMKVAVVPQSRVYHLGGGSLPPSDPRKTYLNYRNNLLMLHKNLPIGVRDKVIFKRMVLDGIAWAKEVATMKWGNASAIVRAHNDFRKIKKVTSQSGNLLSATDMAAQCYDMMKSRPDIITGYFVKGKRKFSDYGLFYGNRS